MQSKIKSMRAKRKAKGPSLPEVRALFDRLGAIGMSVNDFAALCDVNQSTMSRWRSGETEPGLATYLHCKRVLETLG